MKNKVFSFCFCCNLYNYAKIKKYHLAIDTIEVIEADNFAVFDIYDVNEKQYKKIIRLIKKLNLVNDITSIHFDFSTEDAADNFANKLKNYFKSNLADIGVDGWYDNWSAIIRLGYKDSGIKAKHIEHICCKL